MELFTPSGKKIRIHSNIGSVKIMTSGSSRQAFVAPIAADTRESVCLRDRRFLTLTKREREQYSDFLFREHYNRKNPATKKCVSWFFGKEIPKENILENESLFKKYAMRHTFFGSASEKEINFLGVAGNSVETMISLSTFFPERDKTGKFVYIADTAHIQSVKTIAIDIDYEGAYTPEDIIEKLSGSSELAGIIPTIIEYGHRVRFLYVLDTPVYIGRKASEGGRKRILGLISAVGGAIAKRVNDAGKNMFPSIRMNASVQPLTTFYRPEGSIHIKNQAEYTIKRRVTGEMYQLEVLKELLPTLPYSYKEYTEHHKKKATRGNNSSNLMQRRMDGLKACVSFIEPGFRTNYLHIVLNNIYTMTGDVDLSVEYVINTNDLLTKPLSPKTLKCDIISPFRKTQKVYRYKDSTICGKLGFSEEQAAAFGFKQTSVSAGKKYSKSSLIKERLRGTSVKRCAALFGISERTVIRNTADSVRKIEQRIRDLISKQIESALETKEEISRKASDVLTSACSILHSIHRGVRRAATTTIYGKNVTPFFEHYG